MYIILTDSGYLNADGTIQLLRDDAEVFGEKQALLLGRQYNASVLDAFDDDDDAFDDD